MTNAELWELGRYCLALVVGCSLLVVFNVAIHMVGDFIDRRRELRMLDKRRKTTEERDAFGTPNAFVKGIVNRSIVGGCMRCNDYTTTVVVFYLGNCQARLCGSCARKLRDELKGQL